MPTPSPGGCPKCGRVTDTVYEGMCTYCHSIENGYAIGRGGRVEPLHTCTSCGRVGTRSFHFVFPDKWFCDNLKACRKRELSHV